MSVDAIWLPCDAAAVGHEAEIVDHVLNVVGTVAPLWCSKLGVLAGELVAWVEGPRFWSKYGDGAPVDWVEGIGGVAIWIGIGEVAGARAAFVLTVDLLDGNNISSSGPRHHRRR